MGEQLVDEVTQMRRRVYRAETVMVLVAVLAFVGMWAVRKWTLSHIDQALAPQCVSDGECRDTFIHMWMSDVACPRSDQRIEAVANESGFFCRCGGTK